MTNRAIPSVHAAMLSLLVVVLVLVAAGTVTECFAFTFRPCCSVLSAALLANGRATSLSIPHARTLLLSCLCLTPYQYR
ncbi:MAG: hypothetical protein ABUJ92_00345 [Desulfobacterales bacterium]